MAPPLARVMHDIDAPAGVVVTSAIREGKPPDSCSLQLSNMIADLIIVGSKGLGFLDRMLVGSTATGIIRGAQMPVFAFPLAAVTAANRTAAAKAESA